MLIEDVITMPDRLRKFLVENEKRCRHMFQNLDSSGKGTLWREEFEHGLRILCAPVTDDELRQILDSKTQIRYEDFLKAAKGDLLDDGCSSMVSGEAVLKVIRKKLKQKMSRSEWLQLRVRVNRKEKINHAGLRRLLRQYDIFVDREQLISVFQFLKTNERSGCLLDDILHMKVKPRCAKKNNTTALPKLKNVISSTEKGNESDLERTQDLHSTYPKDARMCNMMLVKSVLIREGYVSCTKRLVGSLSHAGGKVKLDKDFCKNLTVLLGELMKLVCEIVHNIEEWKTALIAVEETQVAESTWNARNTKSDDRSQRAFMWKKQNYMVRMSEDLGFLNPIRPMVVSAICEAARIQRVKSLDGFFPVKLHEFFAAEQRIQDEIQTIHGTGKTLGNIKESSEGEQPEEQVSVFGSIIRHAAGQFALEMNLRRSEENLCGGLQPFPGNVPHDSRENQIFSNSNRRRAKRRKKKSLPKLAGVKYIIQNNQALFKNKAPHRTIGRQLFHEAPSVSLNLHDKIDVSKFGVEPQNKFQEMNLTSKCMRRQIRSFEKKRFNANTTSFPAKSNCPVVHRKRALRGKKCQKNKNLGDAKEAGRQLEQMSIAGNEPQRTLESKAYSGNGQESKTLFERDREGEQGFSSDENYSGFLSPMSQTSNRQSKEKELDERFLDFLSPASHLGSNHATQNKDSECSNSDDYDDEFSDDFSECD